MDITPSGAPQGATPPAAGPATPGNKKTLIIIVAIVLGLALLGAGCKLIVGKMVGFGVQKAFEAGTGMKVDEKGDTVTYKGPDGSTMQVTGDAGGSVTFKDSDGQTVEVQSQGEGDIKTMPKKFPTDFPIMAGMTLDSTYSISADGSDTFTLQWTTSASAEAVVQYYESELKSKGWRITATTEANGQYFMSFERGDESAPSDQKDSGWVTTVEEEGKTTVGLVLVTKKQQ